jgi:hypothetical protein
VSHPGFVSMPLGSHEFEFPGMLWLRLDMAMRIERWPVRKALNKPWAFPQGLKPRFILRYLRHD